MLCRSASAASTAQFAREFGYLITRPGTVEVAFSREFLRLSPRWTISAVHVQPLRPCLEFLSILRQHPEISELRWISAGGQELIRESRFGLNQGTRGRGWSDDPVFKGAQASQAYVGAVHFLSLIHI